MFKDFSLGTAINVAIGFFAVVALVAVVNYLFTPAATATNPNPKGPLSV
jgi:hypothetical protein